MLKKMAILAMLPRLSEFLNKTKEDSMQNTPLKVSEFIAFIADGKCPDDELFDYILSVVEGKVDPILYPTPIISILEDMLEWNFKYNIGAGKLYDAVLNKVNTRVFEIDVNFYMRCLLTLARIKGSKLDHFDSVFMLKDLVKDYPKMNNPVFESELLAMYLEALLKIYEEDTDSPRKKSIMFFSEEVLLTEIKRISSLLKPINAFKADIDGEAARTIVQFA